MPATEYEATIPFSIQGQALAIGDKTTLEPQQAKWHLLDGRLTALGAAASAAISGFIFHDADASGLFDGADTPLQGVVMQATDSTSATHTATTDASGNWAFSGLPLGSTTIDVLTLPAGFEVGDEPGNYPLVVTLMAGSNPDAPQLDILTQGGGA